MCSKAYPWHHAKPSTNWTLPREGYELQEVKMLVGVGRGPGQEKAVQGGRRKWDSRGLDQWSSSLPDPELCIRPVQIREILFQGLQLSPEKGNKSPLPPKEISRCFLASIRCNGSHFGTTVATWKLSIGLLEIFSEKESCFPSFPRRPFLSSGEEKRWKEHMKWEGMKVLLNCNMKQNITHIL